MTIHHNGSILFYSLARTIDLCAGESKGFHPVEYPRSHTVMLTEVSGDAGGAISVQCAGGHGRGVRAVNRGHIAEDEDLAAGGTDLVADLHGAEVIPVALVDVAHGAEEMRAGHQGCAGDAGGDRILAGGRRYEGRIRLGRIRQRADLLAVHVRAYGGDILPLR